MELQALLVLCGVGVVGVAVVLLMGLFSASGTSYEDAIAQQRRAATELLALAESKSKSKKNTRKANRKLAKKEKREAVAATGSEPESEAPAESGVEDEVAPAAKPHVDFKPPVVVDVPVDTPPNVKIRKRGKDPKVKPILVNKEDPSCVSDPHAAADPTPANHFEEMHPKDEFELMHSTLTTEKPAEKKEEVVEKKESKPSKAAKGKAAKPAAPKDEPAPEPARERNSSGDAPKEQRKGKKADKKAVEEAPEPVVREEVVPPLNAPQPSELTTDKLLRQVAPPPASVPAPSPAPTPSPVPSASPPATKSKKKKPEANVLAFMAGDGSGVNVGELVRVVRSAALSRTEVQVLTDALLNKHHETLPEHEEWSEGPNDPMQKLKKQLADKEKALADEIEASQALHAKLKELRTHLNAERGKAGLAARSVEQAAAAAAAARADSMALQARLQRLVDENHELAQEKLVLQSKLGMEGEAQQAQRVQMEMHIQSLSEQVNALQAEAAARAHEVAQARCEAAAARDAGMLAQQQLHEISLQLQSANVAYAEAEQQLQCAAMADQAAQERLAALNEAQNEVQRLTSRAQAAENNLEKVKEEAEKQKQQLSAEVSSLSAAAALREAELAELRQLAAAAAAAPAQNGLPPPDHHKVAAAAAETARVEAVVSALRDELANEQRQANDHREQLARLQESLRTYQNKNNEAIAKAQEAQYVEISNVLRAVCPTAAPATKPDGDWLRAFADNLKLELQRREQERELLEKQQLEKQQLETQQLEKQQLEKQQLEKQQLEKEQLESKDSKDAPKIEELESQNEHLQGLVDKYKRIINDTEGVLSQLQHNVTTEEQRWAARLAEAQRELEELRTRTLTQMQNKIDTLQAELQQARAENHNHSFADAERQAEERLMVAGLSDKHSADVLNGPLQVGLQEK